VAEEDDQVKSFPGQPTPLLFQCADIYGNTVELSIENWHHACEVHPEMNDIGTGVVQSVIETPTMISKSKRTNSWRYVFDKWHLLLPRTNIVRVVLEYQNAVIQSGNTSGKVVTAYAPMVSNTGAVGDVIYFAGTDRKTR
jgi:hypothetical protein